MRRAMKWNPNQDMLTNYFEIYHYKDSYLKEVSLHHHDFFELYFFISGEVAYTIESNCYNLRPGDLLLISPDELHQPTIRPAQSYERMVLWINCNYLREMSPVKGELGECFDRSRTYHNNLIRLDEAAQKTIRDMMLSLYNETSGVDKYSEILKYNLLSTLMVAVNRQYLTAPKIETESDLSGVMSHIVDYINENYTQNITLDTLSKRFFISKYHMSREFTKHFGITIHRYITKRRLITAKQLMMQNISPTEVYSKCGFLEYTTFYRAFRIEYGIKPNEFSR